MDISSRENDDHPHRRIDEEAVSVDALKHVLCARCGREQVVVHRELHDPPDFTLRIDGELFFAEVTSIVSQQGRHAQYEDLADAIRNHATTRHGVSGTYALEVFGFPRITTPKSNRGRPVLNAALEYLDATRSWLTAPAVSLVRDESGQILIHKWSADGSTVGVASSGPAMWASEVQSELAALLQQAVDHKQRKLQKAGIDPRRTLLLLYDAFGYGGPEDAVAALQQVKRYDSFHSLFWAASFSNRSNTTYPEEPGRDGLFLFSSNTDWNRCGTIIPETGI